MTGRLVEPHFGVVRPWEYDWVEQVEMIPPYASPTVDAGKIYGVFLAYQEALDALRKIANDCSSSDVLCEHMEAREALEILETGTCDRSKWR